MRHLPSILLVRFSTHRSASSAANSGAAEMAKMKTKRSRTSSASTSTKTNGKVALTVKHGEPKKSARKRTVKKRAAKVDVMKPKKPPTAFFYFLEDFRKEYQEQNPGVKSMRDIGKACGEKWKTMTYEEKVQYYDIATEKRAEFETAMANFTKRKESGEFDEESEFDDDSEFDG